MNSREFFNVVSRPNITAALLEDGNYRLAVNAVLSIDAAYGIMFEQLKGQSHPILQLISSKRKEIQDSDFKDYIASRSSEFRTIRDVAYATKHGKLSGTKARVVYSADDMSSIELVCGLFECGDPLGGSAVFVSSGDGKLERCWVLLRRVELLTDELLGEFGLGPLACPIPDYHKARAS